MLLLAVNGILQFVGVWTFHFRALSGCCACVLSCLMLGAIITTAVFRFNTYGSLAALSLFPTKYDSTIPLDYRVNAI